MVRGVVHFYLAVCLAASAVADDIDLILLAGQSNAQGWQGDAKFYPADDDAVDDSIPFYWVTPGHSSSAGHWTTLRAQGGRFPAGHFGLEVTLARSLKAAGLTPAVFKYSLGSTSIAQNWGGPGDGLMYDQMAAEYRRAVKQLQDEGHQIRVCSFVWIQGESDARTAEMARAYQQRLQSLINDLRERVVGHAEFGIVLGVDEQHPWVQAHPDVIHAQQQIAAGDARIVHSTMVGLQKADSTHLTPAGLEEQGRKISAVLVDELQIAGPDPAQK